jgi:hypothetical protein
MKRTQVGTAVRFQYNPWMNWTMMAVVVFFGGAGLMSAAFGQAEMAASAPEVHRALMWSSGGMFIAGIFGLLITPARAFEIDALDRQVRLLSLYALGTRRRVFAAQDIASFIADEVRHNGPRAFWMYMGLQSGRRVKLSPMAGTPEIAMDVKALISAVVSQGSPSMGSPNLRRRFGQAA